MEQSPDQDTLIEQSPDRDTLIEHSPIFIMYLFSDLSFILLCTGEPI